MKLDKISIQETIKDKIVEIANTLGCDASNLQSDEVIPATGLIDSAGLLELVAWYESYYDIKIETSEITIDNLGTIDSMTDFLLHRKEQL
ncbi:MAG: acyl carrier protein [Betaproteobacteria bacterium]|nr:acyl carrier protein [Betaproteobacteria bacterium]